MKKNIKIILSIFLSIILIGLTSVIVLGNSIPKIPVEIPEFNETEYKEKQLKEKEERIKEIDEEMKNTQGTNTKVETETNVIQETEPSEKEQEIINIINKFYKEEFEQLQMQIENELNNGEMSRNEELKKLTKRGLEMMLEIIETKEITEEERETLKSYFKDQEFYIKAWDESLYESLQDRISNAIK